MQPDAPDEPKMMQKWSQNEAKIEPKTDQKGVGNNVQKNDIKMKRFGGHHGTQKAPKMDPQIVFLATQMEQKFD